MACDDADGWNVEAGVFQELRATLSVSELGDSRRKRVY